MTKFTELSPEFIEYITTKLLDDLHEKLPSMTGAKWVASDSGGGY